MNLSRNFSIGKIFESYMIARRSQSYNKTGLAKSKFVQQVYKIMPDELRFSKLFINLKSLLVKMHVGYSELCALSFLNYILNNQKLDLDDYSNYFIDNEDRRTYNSFFSPVFTK